MEFLQTEISLQWEKKLLKRNIKMEQDLNIALTMLKIVMNHMQLRGVLRLGMVIIVSSKRRDVNSEKRVKGAA